jgi:hypothetical protein
VITELLPQPLPHLSLDEVGQQRAGTLLLLLLLRTSRRSSVRRRGPDTISRPPSAVPASPLTTSAPDGG